MVFPGSEKQAPRANGVHSLQHLWDQQGAESPHIGRCYKICLESPGTHTCVQYLCKSPMKKERHQKRSVSGQACASGSPGSMAESWLQGQNGKMSGQQSPQSLHMLPLAQGVAKMTSPTV